MPRLSRRTLAAVAAVAGLALAVVLCEKDLIDGDFFRVGSRFRRLSRGVEDAEKTKHYQKKYFHLFISANPKL